jgi:hypothetical protein
MFHHAHVLVPSFEKAMLDHSTSSRSPFPTQNEISISSYKFG